MTQTAYFNLLETVLDEWKGTPEELGEVLEVASSIPTVYGYKLDGTPIVDTRREVSTARSRLGQLPHGRELLQEEIRQRRG